MRSRALAVLAVVVLIISIALPVHAAQGGAGRGPHGWGSRRPHERPLLPPPSRWMLLVGGAAVFGAFAFGAALTYPYWAIHIMDIRITRIRTLPTQHRSRRSCINSSPSPRSDRIPAPGGLSTDDGPARGRVPAWKVRAPRRRRDASLAVGVGARRGSIPAVATIPPSAR